MKQPLPARKNFIGDLLATDPLIEAPLAPLIAGVLLSTAEDPEEPVIKLSTRLSRANDLHLQRAAYWLPGRGAKIQAIVNAALANYFEQYPDAHRPTPDE